MNKQQLIINYIPLANKLAWQKSKKTPKNITFEDLKSVAYLGLTEAANRFNQELSSFSTYATITINGKIKDHLRFCGKNDKIEMKFKNSYKDSCLVDDLDFFEFLISKLDSLNQDIFRMYYVEEKTMKQIGGSLGMTESRVSQILKMCHKRLKKVYRGN